MPRANRILGLALAGLSLPWVSQQAVAAEWRIGGTFSQSLSGSAPFGTGSDDGGVSASTSLGIAATGRTPTTTVTIAPSLGFSVSDRQNQTDGGAVRFTPSLRASVNHRLPRLTATGALSVVPQFRSAREFDVALGFDPDTGLPDAVLVPRDVDPLQITINASAGLGYTLGPRDRINANLSAQVVEYTESVEALPATLSYGGTLGWTRELTQRTSGSLTGNIRRFDTDSSTQSGRTTFSLTPGLSHALTPRHRVSVGVGLSYVDGDDSRFGVNANASIAYRTAETAVTLGFSQSFEQADTGELDNVSRVSLTASRQLTPRWSGSVATSLSNTAPIGGGSDRQTFSVGPSLSYALTQRWSVRGSYAFILERVDGDVRGNNLASVQLSRSFDF